MVRKSAFDGPTVDKLHKVDTSIETKRERRLRRVGQFITYGLVTTSTLTAGATALSYDFPLKTEIITAQSVSEQASDGICRPNLYADSMDDPLILPSTKQKMVGACHALYQGGDVALINYANLSELQSDRMEVIVEDRLNEVSDGMIDIDVTVIEPSTAADEAYEEATYPACAPDDKERLGSVIADRTMPELGAYDVVMGLGDMTPCSPGFAGFAIPGTARYAEMFDVKNFIESADETYRQEISDYRSFDAPPRRSQFAEQAVAHEIGHMLGWGHRSSMVGVESDYYPIDDMFNKSRQSLDLQAIIDQTEHVEYDYGNLMGSGELTRFRDVMPAEELEFTQWNAVALGEKPRVESRPITEAPILLSENLNDTIMTVDLETPLVKADDDNLDSSGFNAGGFTQVTVSPFRYKLQDGTLGTMDGLNIGLRSQDLNRTLDLGTLHLPYSDDVPRNFTNKLITPSGTIVIKSTGVFTTVQLVKE